MDKLRFVATGSDSFYGEYLYDQIVGQDHFLRKLKAILDWEYFTTRLIKLYKGEGVLGNRSTGLNEVKAALSLCPVTLFTRF